MSDPAIYVENLTKSYRIWRDPAARLKAPLWDAIKGLAPRGLRDAGAGAPSPYYKEHFAIRDISFEVRRGETVGIVGRNGSGKSTLLKIICGTLQPTSGVARTRGLITALLELGSGFNPEFTGRENVFLNASVLGLGQKETLAKMEEILAFADIGAFIDQPVKTYSSGMAMRLAFAVQTAVSPGILVVDEALSVGDEAFQRKCFGRIEKLREAGATVLFVSHDASAVLRLCNRALLLKNGRVFVQGRPKAVVSIYQKGLLDAKADEKTLLREFAELEAQAAKEPKPAAGASARPQAEAPGQDNDPAFLDPSLLKHKPLEYSENGAVISEVCIKTLGGRQVNCLEHGREYVYSYVVHFKRRVDKVLFGNLIKLANGFELGGMTSHPRDGDWFAAREGERHLVSFRFPCLLSPGSYAMNAGVLASLPEGEQYLARMIDALLFRVNPQTGLLHTSHVDFLGRATLARLQQP